MKRPAARRSVFLNWLLSYWIVLACALLASVLVFAGASQALDREVRKVETANLATLRTLLDGKLQEVEAAAFLLQYEANVQAFVHEANPFYNPALAIEPKRAEDQMVQAVHANSMIRDVFLYSYKSGVFLSTLYGINDTGAIPLPAERTFGLTNDALETLVIGEFTHPEYVILPPVDAGGESQILLLVNVYPRGITPEGALMIRLDTAKFLEPASGVSGLQDYGFLVLDASGNRLVRNAAGVADLPVRFEDLPDGPATLDFDGREYLVSATGSERNEWKYVLLSSVDAYRSGIRETRSWTVGAILAFLVLGSLISYLFARRNYSPIRRLMERVSRSVGPQGTGNRNELQYLEDAVQKVIVEKDLYSKRLERSGTALRDSLLARLAKGRVQDRAEFAAMLAENGVRFPSDRFLVLAMVVEDFGLLLTGDDPDPDVRQVSELASFLVRNVLEEKYAEVPGGSAAVFEVDGLLVCLVGLPAGEESPDCPALAAVAQDGLGFLRDRFGVLVSAGVGSVQATLAGVARSYQDAVDALDYARLFDAVGSVRCHGDRDEGAPAMPGASPLSTRRQLLNHLMAFDYRSVETLVNRVIDEDVLAQGNPTIRRMRQYSLVEDLLAALDELSAGQPPAFRKEADALLDALATSNELTEFRRTIHEFLSCMEDLHARKEASLQHHGKLQRIVDYIQANLSDPDLSVTKLADHVDLSVSQVTRLMRARLGMGTLDYIQQCRIDLARKYLAETDMGVAEIAKKVGYYNFRTMNSIFKKLEGVTGTQYRERMRSR